MLVISTQKYLPFNCLKRDQPIYYLPLLHTIRTEEKFGLLHRTVLMTNLHIQWKHFLLIILTNASLSLLLRFLFFLLLLLHCRLCNSLWPNPPLAIVNINIILCTKLILINSYCAITFFQGALAPYTRANTRGKKRTKNATTTTTKDKNDDNKRHIKHQ